MFIRRKEESRDDQLALIPDLIDFATASPLNSEVPFEQLPMLDAQPFVNVGIIQNARVIEFTLLSRYKCNGISVHAGRYKAVLANDKIVIEGLGEWSEVLFELESNRPLFSQRADFVLHDVQIGINFHWQRTQDQRFGNCLRLIVASSGIVAVNSLPVEDYIASVVASEMAGTSDIELLKAHAVISRSWLMRPIVEHVAASAAVSEAATDDKIVRYYERDAHTLFDVCADDHCQRYQGFTSSFSEVALQAVQQTAGLVLAWHGHICDARFSKCCGGLSENFSTAWSDNDVEYLSPVRCIDTLDAVPDLTTDAGVRAWIEQPPVSFCSVHSKRVLSQVLNSYDRETPDFYRWQVRYTVDELSRIVREKSGIDFGLVQQLVPVRRGQSGRIIALRIEGTKRTMTIGKELEIRRILSPSHLYSSAFIVLRDGDAFVLKGAGWGHGVGLCQIGAAAMADKGYDYRQILRHYYTNSSIQPLWRID